MSADTKEKRTLCSLVEKIIEKGELDTEDQELINAQARLGGAAAENIEALNHLTDLIKSGDVRVN